MIINRIYKPKSILMTDKCYIVSAAGLEGKNEETIEVLIAFFSIKVLNEIIMVLILLKHSCLSNSTQSILKNKINNFRKPIYG